MGSLDDYTGPKNEWIKQNGYIEGERVFRPHMVSVRIAQLMSLDGLTDVVLLGLVAKCDQCDEDHEFIFELPPDDAVSLGFDLMDSEIQRYGMPEGYQSAAGGSWWQRLVNRARKLNQPAPERSGVQS